MKNVIDFREARERKAEKNVDMTRRRYDAGACSTKEMADALTRFVDTLPKD